MKDLRSPAATKSVIKGRPDYYITPTRDFTKYTRDSEEKYWSNETRFDWQQNVRINLKERLESLSPEDLSNVTFMVLPMVNETIERKIVEIREGQLPLEQDALKDISECVPSDRTTMDEALLIQSPLKALQSSVSRLKDQLEIMHGELVDLRAQQRLGFFKAGATVKQLETEAEKQEQRRQLSRLTDQVRQVEKDQEGSRTKYQAESDELKRKTRSELRLIEPQVLADLEETRELLRRTLLAKRLPADRRDLFRIMDLVLKRQLRGLKDIANHALVVEQSAIAPLTMGIIHYKRHREIQEAMTTFINDEAKHSATFRRFLVEKLEAKEFISAQLIKGAGRYMWLARFMPAAGMFLAVVVEVIGAATLEFFGNEKYMPDRLFCSICKTISLQDEQRHMALCVAMYNELFRKGNRLEQFRNSMTLKILLKSVYGDKTDDHHLIQAFRAFGVESDILYQHVVHRMSQELGRISMYVEPGRLLEIIGRKPKDSNTQKDPI